MEIRGTTFVIFKIGTLIESYEHEAPRLFSHFGVEHIDTREVVQRAIVAKVEKVEGSSMFKVTSVVFWAKEEAVKEEDEFEWLKSLGDK